MTRGRRWVAVALAATLPAIPHIDQSAGVRAERAATAEEPPAAPADATSSVLFAENVGQAGDEFSFTVLGGEGSAAFGADGLTSVSAGEHVRVSFDGRSHVDPIGIGPTDATASWALATTEHQAPAALYSGVEYPDVWPGIDARYGGSGGRLKSEFLVAPGALPTDVRLVYEGAHASIAEDDSLRLVTPGGQELVDDAPDAYQDLPSGERVTVPAAYAVAQRADGRSVVSIDVGRYDASVALVLDPLSLAGATLFGGSGADALADVHEFSDGSVVVVGHTNSPDLPGAAAPPTGRDLVVARLRADRSLQWVTVLGGSGDDEALAVDASPSGAVIVGGSTTSADLPANGWQAANAGGVDGVVARFGPDGALQAVSYLGGTGDDRVTAVAFDVSGSPASDAPFVAGTTTSVDLPVTPGAAQPNAGGDADGFVAGFGGASAPSFVSYLGGTATDDVGGIDVGSADGVTEVAVVGTTSSPDLPVPDAFDPILSGPTDGYIATYDVAGGLLAATYFGGAGVDGLADVSSQGRAHRVGGWSDGFGVPYDGGGGVDVLVSRLFARSLTGGPTFGSSLRTVRIGGPGDDRATALGGGVTASVVGTTTSSSFPPLGTVPQNSPGGGIDGFVLQLINNDPSRLSFLGGAGDDEPLGASDGVVVGRTTSGDFPNVTAGADPAGDGFVADYVDLPGGPATSLDGISPTATPGVSSVAVTDLAPAAPPAVLAATAAAPLRAVDLGGSIASTPLRAVPLRAVPLRAVPLRAVPLSSVPTEAGGGWNQLLVGTPYEGLPLQSVTLAQVLALPQASDPAHPLGRLALGDLDLSGSPLGSMSLAALAYGSVLLDDIPVGDLNADGEANFADWVVLLAGMGLDATGLGLDPGSTVVAADVAGVPLRAVPLRAVPLRAVDVAALGIAATPLRAVLLAPTPLRAVPLRAVPLRAVELVFDCFLVDCANLPDSTIGELLDAEGPTVIRDAAVLSDLEEYGVTTVGDVLLALLDPSSYVFSGGADQGSLVAAAGDGANRVPISAGFVLQEDGTWPIQATLTSPAGWTLVRETARVTINGVPGLNQFAQFSSFPGGVTELLGRSTGQLLQAGDEIRLEVEAIPPLALGAGTWTGQVGVVGLGGVNTSVAVTVGQDPALESAGPDDAPVLVPGQVYVPHLPPGDTDWFRIVVPVGAPVSVDLGPVPADLDLIVYAPPGGPAAETLRPPDARAPAIVPLEPADPTIQEAASASDPSVLADVPLLPGRVPTATSIRRGRSPETATFTATVAGTYVVQVSGWNGAGSAQPYQLRVRQGRVPGTGSCVEPIAPDAGQDAGRPLPTSLPPGIETLLLVNADRLADQYGAPAANEVLAALDALAADGAVHGVVVPVDGSADVRAATAAWNLAPCDPAAANEVVRSINRVVDGLLAGSPSATETIRSIVLIGDDDQLPFARIADGTLLSNEAQHAGEVLAADGRGTPVSAALAAANILTDDPYADLGGPAPWGSRWLYVPEIASGRLVETPVEIVAQIRQFIDVGGRLDPTIAFTSGYDFLSDGAQAVDGALADAGLRTTRLLGETWTGQELLDGLLPPAADAPGVASINAHFDQTHLLPADGNHDATIDDLVGTADLPSPSLARLVGTLAFSMGCHAGLPSADRVHPASAPESLDWAQAFARQLSVFVGNTGYGYGDTAVVAYSEALMAGFAARLDGSVLAGEALSDAKAAYAGSLLPVAASEYDRKVMAEATFYGLPMYRVGDAPEPPAPPQPRPTTIDHGLVSSTATATAAPTQRIGPDGTTFWTSGADAPLVVDGRPIQPRTSIDITQPGITATGVMIESLASVDVVANVTVSRPVVDRAANEPAVPSTDEAFPAALAGVSTTATSTGQRQHAIVAAGQFRTDLDPATAAGVGIQRLFSSIGLRAYYGDGTDVTAPAIGVARAGLAGAGEVRFEVTTADGESGVRRVLVLYLDDGGTWQRLDLGDQGDGTWAGVGPAAGANVDYFVQALNGSGLVGVASGKGRMLHASLQAPPAAAVPVVDLGADRAVIVGRPLFVAGSVSAVGAPTSATVDLGRGAGPMPLTVTDGEFSIQTVFDVPGTYVVTAQVCTADGCGGDSVRVDVAAAGALQPGPAVEAAVGEPAVVTATATPAALAWTATVDGHPASVAGGSIRGSVATSTPGSRAVPVVACAPSGECVSTTVQLTVFAPPVAPAWTVVAGDPGEVSPGADGRDVALTGSGERRALATPAPGRPGEVGFTLDVDAGLLATGSAGLLLGGGSWSIELCRPLPLLGPSLVVNRLRSGRYQPVAQSPLPLLFPWTAPLQVIATISPSGADTRVVVRLDPIGPGPTHTFSVTLSGVVTGEAGVRATGQLGARIGSWQTA